MRAKVVEETREVEQRAQQKAQEHRLELEPTPREKQGFVEFVKETELDAHAQATVASGSADKYVARAKWSKRLLGPVPWALLIGAVPLLYMVWQWAGTYMSVEFAAAGVAMLLTWLILLISNSRRHSRCDENAKRLYQTASKYLVLAERAKSFRLVHAERLDTRSRLKDLTEKLHREKVELDNKFHPRIAEVEQARDSVRHRISVENIDPLNDFDERLEDAEESVRVAKA